MSNVIHYELLCEYIIGKSRIMFRQRVTTKVPRMYVSLLHIWCNGKADDRAKNVEINEKAPRSLSPGNYRSVTQGNLGWHADHPARKVDHSNGDSDGSPVNRSDLRLDLSQWNRFLYRHIALTIFVTGKYVCVYKCIPSTIVSLLTIITVCVVNWHTYVMKLSYA